MAVIIFIERNARIEDRILIRGDSDETLTRRSVTNNPWPYTPFGAPEISISATVGRERTDTWYNIVRVPIPFDTML